MFPLATFFPTGIPPVVQVFTGDMGGAQTINKPAGATRLMAEAIGGGAPSVTRSPANGGSGAHYARRNAYNVAGLTSVNISPGGPGQASSVTDPSGNTIVSASPGVGQAGNPASSSTGDVINVGGAGVQSSTGGGGGAGGPNGPGASATGSTGGAGGGVTGFSGNGGGAGAPGNPYGGGAGVGSDGSGNPFKGGTGWLQLTWSFS